MCDLRTCLWLRDQILFKMLLKISVEKCPTAATGTRGSLGLGALATESHHGPNTDSHLGPTDSTNTSSEESVTPSHENRLEMTISLDLEI
jgi:hypothetical protein